MAEEIRPSIRATWFGIGAGSASKANARRVFVEAIESAVSHVGCDANRAPQSFLEHFRASARQSRR
jgi:hypothetical protein